MATYITKEIAGFASDLIIDIAETMDGLFLWANIKGGKINEDRTSYEEITVEDMENGITKTLTIRDIELATNKLSLREIKALRAGDFDWLMADKVLQLAMHKKVIYG